MVKSQEKWYSKHHLSTYLVLKTPFGTKIPLLFKNMVATGGAHFFHPRVWTGLGSIGGCTRRAGIVKILRYYGGMPPALRVRWSSQCVRLLSVRELVANRTTPHEKE